MDWTGVESKNICQFYHSMFHITPVQSMIMCRDEGLDGELWTRLAEQVESELWEAKQLKINLILVDLYHQLPTLSQSKKNIPMSSMS